MTSIKTAISIEESLYEEVTALANAMQIPRSKLFAIAMEEFLRRQKNRQLVESVNEAKAMGNVLLELGEANLDRQSVVNVPQIFTVDKALLTEKIGKLSKERIRQILAGLTIVTEPQEIDFAE
ncbi:MAG: type II toxin-antitoxin system PemK/MazF family toxin [Aphanizomenon gracile PMC649.10]|jgi:predicted transcriptional regulator|nr:type II toxin-antitoxin system PemK/MazF family toxin [Aphanizomenon gracile PMC638.10]MDM3851041.1 type II toxin-antitoxin system PemK/MazF family toxin [Aphanizomenon gracile PMC627.10]MDM3855830.1 type II toxin-antitoxin system PemK/MazF family toxin [Aphanizomenon gracile PMC649.10]MDM3859671.1 type II toxin-antitoxin system PemK/MazF family toxin [Aphanizomenon gracile PMC644.10]